VQSQSNSATRDEKEKSKSHHCCEKRKKIKIKWKLGNKTLLTMLLFDSLVLLLAS
jgi:hypothetical protein